VPANSNLLGQIRPGYLEECSGRHADTQDKMEESQSCLASLQSSVALGQCIVIHVPQVELFFSDTLDDCNLERATSLNNPYRNAFDSRGKSSRLPQGRPISASDRPVPVVIIPPHTEIYSNDQGSAPVIVDRKWECHQQPSLPYSASTESSLPTYHRTDPCPTRRLRLLP
jgi:hypothetical protein